MAFRTDFGLPVSFYDEALHAGPTEPAALTLRYPLLVRDAVDEPPRLHGLRLGLGAFSPPSLAFGSAKAALPPSTDQKRQPLTRA